MWQNELSHSPSCLMFHVHEISFCYTLPTLPHCVHWASLIYKPMVVFKQASQKIVQTSERNVCCLPGSKLVLNKKCGDRRGGMGSVNILSIIFFQVSYQDIGRSYVNKYQFCIFICVNTWITILKNVILPLIKQVTHITFMAEGRIDGFL